MPKPARRILLTLPLLVAVIGCTPVRETPSKGPVAYTLGATLWFQTSAEARALCYQAYTLAQSRLDKILEMRRPGKPAAVILDIDETVLDNSPHQAKLLQTAQEYPAFWDEWVERAEARPLPGAQEFLQHTVHRGVSVFYVSNRDIRSLDATLRNLRRAGLPACDSAHVLLRDGTSSKELRRKQIARDYEVVLLLGDNLADFSEAFDRAPLAERQEAVDRMRGEFGSRFILIPNPVYGDWDRALLNYHSGLPDEEQERLRVKALQSF